MRMQLSIACIAFAVGKACLACPPRAQDTIPGMTHRTLQTLAKLEKNISAVEFDEEPFEEVVRWFKEQGIKNMHVHWRYLEETSSIDASTPVTVNLENVTLQEVLDEVMFTISEPAVSDEDRLSYHIKGGIIYISSIEKFKNKMVVRVYSVEHLLRKKVFYSDAPEISVEDSGNGGGSGGASGGSQGGGQGNSGSGGSGILSGGSQGGGQGGGRGGASGGGEGGDVDHEGHRHDALERLVELIKSIKPESWVDAGGKGTIGEHHGKLVVYQTMEMHEIIGGHRLGKVRHVRRVGH